MSDDILKGLSGERYMNALTRQMREVYQAAQDDLLKALRSEKLTNFAEMRTGQLLKQVNAQITALDAVALDVAKNGIPVAYRRGFDLTAEQLTNMGEKTSALNFGSRIHTRSIQALSEQMILDLTTVNQGMRQTFEQYIRRTQQFAISDSAFSEEIAKGNIMGFARRDTSDAILDRLNKGLLVDGKVKINERFFEPGYYAELVTRTRTREASTVGALNTAKQAGLDLVQVSVHHHPDEDPCSPHQGRVYSISGEDETFPKLTAKPPFHPNCKHVLVPVTKNHLERIGELKAAEALAKDKDATITTHDDWKALLAKHQDKPKSPPPPPPTGIAAIPRGIDGADEFGSKLKPVSGGPKLGGSTGAKLFEDDEGVKWVVKNYSGKELQAQNEFLANRIYETVGVGVPESRLARLDGAIAVANRFIDEPGAKVAGFGGREALRDSAAFKRGFAADALLANWDVAGLEYDNLMMVPGKKSKVWRIDNGGALLFRAQGGLKGQAFGPTVTELKTLRDPSLNPSSAFMFGAITKKDMNGYITTLRQRVKPETFRTAIAEAGMPAAEAKLLQEILEARLKNLKQWQARYKTEQKSSAAILAASGDSRPGTRRYKVHSTLAVSAEQAEAAVLAARKVIPEAQYRAMRYYTNDGSRVLNNRAWKEGVGDKDLDDLLAGDVYPGWIGWAARKTNMEPQRDLKMANWKSGEWAYVDWVAYSSSSIRWDIWGDTGGITYLIASKGLQGSYVGKASSVPSEHELLIGRNSVFRVIGWDEQNGRKFVFVEETTDEIPITQSPPPRIDYFAFEEAWKKHYFAGKDTSEVSIEDFKYDG